MNEVIFSSPPRRRPTNRLRRPAPNSFFHNLPKAPATIPSSSCSARPHQAPRTSSAAMAIRAACYGNDLRKLPSSAEEGKADAVAAAGVVLVNGIILLISTTPAARADEASRPFLCRAATPPHLRRVFCCPVIPASTAD